MNPQNERKKQIDIARLSFIILISGSFVTLLAYTVRIFSNNENYILILPFILLIVLVTAAVLFNVSAYSRKQGKRFRAFRDTYPISYMCRPDLDMTPCVYAITKDRTDIVIFDVSKKHYVELQRIPVNNTAITTAEVSTNGVLTFAGLQVASNSYNARFILLDDKSPILRASSSHSYAKEVAEKLSI